MKNVFKSKGNNNKNVLNRIIVFTIVLILFITFFLLSRFNKNISSNLVKISESEITRVIYRFITDKINNEILNKDTINDILIINKNENDEIVYVDFDLDKAYKVLDLVSDTLTNSFKRLDNGLVDVAYFDDYLSHKVNGLTLNIPFGSVTNSSYFYNLGPKIPVRINFIGSVLTNLVTKVTDYGLNNVLVEVFIYIEFQSDIMAPFKTKEIKLKYDAVIASKMIEGRVPNFYNGSMEKQSKIYSKNID